MRRITFIQLYNINYLIQPFFFQSQEGDSGLSFSGYSGIVVGTLAGVMMLVILVTTFVQFRSKIRLIIGRNGYTKSIGGKTTKRTDKRNLPI